MPKHTLIFGNGLGMAIDGQYFALRSGLQSVWNGSEHFTAKHKRLVLSAIPGLSVDQYPESEKQLDQLQIAMAASEFLKGFESDDVKWLSDMSREFPQAFRRFIHEVASYFHHSGRTLPGTFADPLSEFIKETKSHVAVLNYDNLLYDSFTKTEVLSGFTVLIDGFLSTGFAKKNLNRYANQGWYLHLHGSPLFVGNRKRVRDERSFFVPDETSHIVLTHVEHKPLVIAYSPILSEYWSRLAEALNESNKIIVFGYSGFDTHLNDTVTSNCHGKEIHIIEWAGSGNIEERAREWRDSLDGCDIHLRHLDNPLEFNDWRAL